MEVAKAAAERGGRADGSERAVPWLFLMFSLPRCRCLLISSDLIIFLSFSCCSSWCPTSAGKPWKDWKPSGTSRTGRWVCSQWAAQGPVISQGAAAKRGSVAAIRGVLGRSRVKPMPLLLCRARTCIAVPTPSRLPPVCLSPFEREWRQCRRRASTTKEQQPPPRRSRLLPTDTRAPPSTT